MAAPRLSAAQLQSRALSGVTWTVVNVLVSLPIGFAVNILLARVLGVAGFGRLAYLTAAMEFVTGLVDIGTSAALAQFGSRAHAGGDQASVQRMLSRTQGFRLIVTAPLLTVFVIVLVDMSAPLVALTVALGVWLPAALSGVQDSLTLENRTQVGAKIAMATTALTQAAVVVVALTMRSAGGVWAARLVMSNVGLLLAFVYVAKEYRRAVIHPRFPSGMPAGFWRFALPTAAAGLVGTLVVTRSEVFVLQWLSTPEAVGVYALAFGLATHIFAPATALTNPLTPAVSGLYEVGPEKLQTAFLRALRVSSLATGGVLVLITPALASLITTVYGGGFAQSRLVLLALVVSTGATTLAGPVVAFILAQRAPWKLLLANSAALAVDAAAAFSLVPLIGVWGAVAASGACALVLLGLFVMIVESRLRVGLGRIARSLALMPISGACSALAWWVGEAVSSDAIVAAVLSLVIATAGLLACMRLARLGLTDGDTQAVLRNVPQRLAGPGARLLAVVTIRMRTS